MRVQLGDLAADPAGPFRLSLSEQTQIHVEHSGPPSPNVYGVCWEGGGQHDATYHSVVGRILEGCQRVDGAEREGNESQSECRRQPPTRINWLGKAPHTSGQAGPPSASTRRMTPVDRPATSVMGLRASVPRTAEIAAQLNPYHVGRWPNAAQCRYLRFRFGDVLASG